MVTGIETTFPQGCTVSIRHKKSGKLSKGTVARALRVPGSTTEIITVNIPSEGAISFIRREDGYFYIPAIHGEDHRHIIFRVNGGE